MNFVHGLHFQNVKGDIFGGLTAAVVALPLALAFGVASGAGPVAGLYGAIIVGFFAAVFGGTPAQVSGPTGPMTVVMAGVISQYQHDPAMAFTVVMMAGLMQIGFGAMRFGRYISLMPAPVISGFMSGIGCIIIVLQTAPLLGHATPEGGIIGSFMALPEIVLSFNSDAIIVGIMALAISYLLPAKIAKFMPPALVALVAGTLAVLYLFPTAPILGDIPTGFPALQLPQFELALLDEMIVSAFVLALLGAIDSLLTSLIADNITHTHHHSDRELVGQGIGNTIAGLFGAIPGAGATMRTVINVRTGGLTPLSGALHALVLLAIVLGLGDLAKNIPHAVLAGILIKVGIDIIDWGYLKRLRRAPRAGVFFMLTVLFLTVFVDLITAVIVGIVLASLLFVQRMSDLQLANIEKITGEPENSDSTGLTDQDTAILAACGERVAFFRLVGPFSFGAAKGMLKYLTRDNTYDVLVLDLTAVSMLDSSASLALEDVIKRAQSHDKDVYLAGVRPEVHIILDQLAVISLLPDLNYFDTASAALVSAAKSLNLETVK